MSEYSKKLKDPRWQKRRLEIFERDGWKCQLCGDKDSTLVVHHKDYFEGHDPWDYPDRFLVTLCESCHTTELERFQDEQAIIMALKPNFYCNDLSILFHAFLDLRLKDPSDSFIVAETIRWFLTDPEVLKELTDRCWKDIQSHSRPHSNS